MTRVQSKISERNYKDELEQDVFRLHQCFLLASRWCRFLLIAVWTVESQISCVACFVFKIISTSEQQAFSLVHGHDQCSGSLKSEFICRIYTHTKFPYSVHLLKDLYISLYIHIYMGRRKIKENYFLVFLVNMTVNVSDVQCGCDYGPVCDFFFFRLNLSHL